jgi:hypothetical protein
MKIKPREIKPKKVMFSQRVNEELLKKVRAKAKKENVAMADIIHWAFEQYLNMEVK